MATIETPEPSEYADLAEWATNHANVELALDTHGITAVLHHQSQNVDLIDEEKYWDNPRRTKAKRVFDDLGSLVAYSRRFDTTDQAVYVGPKSIVLVLNDHTSAFAGWTDHTATMTLTRTPGWEALIGASGKAMDQGEFAEVVETLAQQWLTPDGATMLEIAQTIEFAGERTYKSARRLSDGSLSLAYVDNQTAKAGSSGDLQVPTRVELAVNVFEGVKSAAQVAGRLRTRLKDAQALFALLLDLSVAEIERQARVVIADTLRAELAGIPVHLGSPTA